MWARVKEVTKKGMQKWRVGDLLVDERCSPAVLDFAKHPCRENGPTGGGKLGQWGRRGGADEVKERPAGFWYRVSFVISLMRVRLLFFL